MNSSTEKNWSDLLKGARQGDKALEDQFYSRLAVTLLPIVQSRLRGWSSATHQDVLQDTLITVNQKLQQIQTQPHHFAAGILRNKIGDLLRTGKRRTMISIDRHEETDEKVLPFDVEQALVDQSISGDPLSRLEAKNQLDHVIRSIQKLGSFCRRIFTAILQQQELADIWKAIQQNEPELKNSAFRKRVFDCRMRLKQILQEG